MKKLFLCLAIFGLLVTGCEKDEVGNDSGLPALPDPDDVCSGMDDLVFSSYCYLNFDANNKDGKISRKEAYAVDKIDLTVTAYTTVRSLKGIGYFPNLKILNCAGCFLLESVDLSNNLKMTSIGETAFYGCSSLLSIMLPHKIISIGDSAFSGCRSLTDIYCAPAIPPVLGTYVFSNISSAVKIYVPTQSVDAYKAAEGWSEYSPYIVGYDFGSGAGDDSSSNGRASITVDGKSTMQAAVKDEGETVDVKVVSTSDWTLVFDDEKQMWLEASAKSGKGGESTVTFTVKEALPKGVTSRTVTAMFRTRGFMFGTEYWVKAIVTVTQSESNSY